MLLGSESVFAQLAHPIHQALNQYRLGELSADEAIRFQISHLTSQQAADEPEFLKCLTPLFSMVEANRNTLSTETLAAYEAFIRQAPTAANVQAQAEYVTPGGKFTIVYTTAGRDAIPTADINNNLIPDYIEEVAEAADSSYRHEILTLGFTDPIPDGETYDIFIEDLSGFGAYGLTYSSTSGQFACRDASPRTCIYIENDFAGYPGNDDPEGDAIGAVKVTVAHEFKHAIQYAQNSWTGNADRWAEMDATLMEEVVYDPVNDYYNYIQGFSTDLFSSPSITLNAGSYEDVTWALFFHEHLGPLFWTGVWQRIENNRNIDLLDAVDEEITAMGLSYEQTVLQSYMWHFASGSELSNPNFGFDESAFYPNPNIAVRYDALQSILTGAIPINPFAARYYLINPLETPSGYLQLSVNSSSDEIHYGLLGYKNDGTLDTQFIVGNNDRLVQEIQNDWLWADYTNIGLVVMNTNTAVSENYRFQFEEYFIDTEIALSQNYPNPFNPQTIIRITVPARQRIELDIYDVTGRHIQTLANEILDPGFKEFTFNAGRLASGIYLYRVKGENETLYKTMTLIK